MKVVALLQNAWSPVYAGRTWPRRLWLRALARSRSGTRLRVLEEAAGPSVSWWYDNTTPIVGGTSDSIIEPNYEHVQQVLSAQRPDAVVGLGKQAAAVLRDMGLHHGVCPAVLLLPHPACRVLPDSLYRKAGGILRKGFEGTVQLFIQKPLLENKDLTTKKLRKVIDANLESRRNLSAALLGDTSC